MYKDKFDSDDNVKIYVPKTSAESIASAAVQETDEVRIYSCADRKSGSGRSFPDKAEDSPRR